MFSSVATDFGSWTITQNYTNLSFVRLLNIVLVFGDLNPTRV